MGTYGPYTATLNKVVTVTGLDPNADRLFIVNESIYTLAIGFGDSAPSPLATLVGDPWVFSVPPGGQMVPIPMRFFGAQHFNGKVYVLAQDPISASQAYSGTISTNTAFYVVALLPGDLAPGNYSTPQATNLASQPRVIAIPIPAPIYTGLWTPANGSDVLTLAVWALSPANMANLGAAIYLYAVDCDMANSNPGFAVIAAKIVAQPRSSAHVNNGNAAVLATFQLAANQNASDHVSRQHTVIGTQSVGLAASSTEVALQIQMTYLNLGPNLIYNICASLDSDNDIAPDTVGATSVKLPGGANNANIW